MSKKFALELTLRPVSTPDAEDTSGYALQQGSTTPTTSPIGSIVVPVAIRLPLPGPAPERPLNFSITDDVQGYVIDPSNRSAVLLIPAIVRAFNPQPDPPKTAEGNDVQGFRWMEEMTNTNEGMDGPSSGSWYGGLVVCYQFLTDPFGTFASAAANTKP
jgi:hypothetical protein